MTSPVIDPWLFTEHTYVSVLRVTVRGGSSSNSSQSGNRIYYVQGQSRIIFNLVYIN